MKQLFLALAFILGLNYALGSIQVVFDDRVPEKFSRVIHTERRTSVATTNLQQHIVEFFWDRITHEGDWHAIIMDVSGIDVSYVYADDYRDWFIAGIVEHSTLQLDVNITVYGMEPIWFDDRTPNDGSVEIHHETQISEETSVITSHQVNFEWNGAASAQRWTAIRMRVKDFHLGWVFEDLTGRWFVAGVNGTVNKLEVECTVWGLPDTRVRNAEEEEEDREETKWVYLEGHGWENKAMEQYTDVVYTPAQPPRNRRITDRRIKEKF